MRSDQIKILHRGKRREGQDQSQSFRFLNTSDGPERKLFKCQVCYLPSSQLEKPFLQPVNVFKYIWNSERPSSPQTPNTYCAGPCCSALFVHSRCLVPSVHEQQLGASRESPSEFCQWNYQWPLGSELEVSKRDLKEMETGFMHLTWELTGRY